MGGLVRAEFRKIRTVNLWWALLIPVAVLSFFAGLVGTAIGSIPELQESAGRPVPVGLLTVSLSTNYSTIFAALFGTLAVASEHRNKSITTTYLTANPRAAILGAKLIAYVNVGLLYGLVNVLFSSVGGLLGAGTAGFGDIVSWFTVCGAGLLAMVLWTLLGVGFGALVTNSVVAVISLVAYKFVIEFVVSTILLGSEVAGIVAYLPGSAGNGIIGNLAVPIFIDNIAGAREPMVPVQAFEVLHFFFGGSYGHPWWLSLLTFLGYTVVFVAGGWQLGNRRDIT